MRPAIPAALALLALVAQPPAFRARYKCASARGGVVYQDTAWPAGKELRELEADPPTLSIVPGTPLPAPQSKAKPKSASSQDSRPPSARATAQRVKGGNA